jgi:hypothetical protein
MSFDEINELIKEKTRQEREGWEKERWNWFYVLISQGSQAKSPKDIIIFPWEKKEVKTKVLTKAQIEKKANQAKKWLNNR